MAQKTGGRQADVRLVGDLSLRRRGPVVVATDASLYNGRVGRGFVSTCGVYGLNAHLYPSYLGGGDVTAVAELRAVHFAMESLDHHPHTEPFTLLCDSEACLRFLRLWARGGTELPRGYSETVRSGGRAAALVRLRDMVHYRRGVLTFVHQQAHAAHPLNEVADSLAKLGLRTYRGQVERGDVPRLARLWADRGVKDFHAVRG